MGVSSKYNLTEGGIVNKLSLVALPLIGTSLIQMTYNLTDMFWLGRLDSDSVAAAGIAGMFLWMSMAFMIIGRMGAEIGVSQNFGRGEKETARIFSQNAIVISIFVGIFLALIFIIGSTFFISLFGIQEAHVAADTRDYLVIVSFGLPFFFPSAAIAGTYNGVGNSRMSLKINAVGIVINVILSPILIFPAGLGIRGAAVATVIAQGIAAIVAVIAIKKHKDRPFEKIKVFCLPKLNIAKQIFKWVLPVSIESFLFTTLSMIIAGFVAYYGADAIAAHRVSIQIESLTWLIGGGFASALTAFVGQNYGAGKWPRIHRSFKVSTGMMIGWGIIVTATIFFGARALILIFIPDNPEVLRIGVECLRIFAVCQIPQCLEGVASGAFRGRGKTVPPSVSSVVSNSFRVVLAFFLSFHTPLGLTGIWIAVAIGSAMRGIWVYLWYLINMRKLPKEDVPIETLA